jgi:methylated-DNA-protein-cysteine methyltransferase-like protein
MSRQTRHEAQAEEIKSSESGYFAQVHALVRQVPAGRVVSYGQIAAALGDPRRARVVGWAMRACPDDVPWHRVVNSRGGLSLGPAHGGVNLQRALLEDEGIEFDAAEHIDLRVYGWQPPAREG